MSATRTPSLVTGMRSRAGRRLRRVRAETAFAAFMLLAATGFQLARQPGVPSWETIWQEDGAIFYTAAWNQEFLATVWEPYNSYLHIVPRLIAELVVLLPLEAAALGLSVGAALVVAALGLYVFHASGAIFTSLWARVLMAAMIVVLPAGGYETTANVANLHWYLVYATFWVFVANPRTRGGVAVGAVITAAAVLSDPLAVLILPLVARRVWQSRHDRLTLVIPAIFAIGLAVQLVVGVLDEQTGRNASSSWADLPGVYALRVAGSALVGDAELGRLWLPHGYAFAYTALAVVAAVLVYGFLKADPPRRWFIGESALYSVLTLCIPLMLRGTENFLDRANYTLNGSRYTVLPILFLVGAMIQVFDARDRRVSPARWRYVQVAAAVFFAALIVSSFKVTTVRTAGPSWKEKLVEARQECAARAAGKEPELIQRLPRAPGEEPTPRSLVRIPISPHIVLPDGNVEVPFATAIPCADLR